MGNPVDGSYESLIQGVSQQSPSDRLDGQHEEQINMNNDPEKGLLRRPPTNLITTLGVSGDLYKEFELEGTKYLLVTYKNTGDIKVFDVDTGASVPLLVSNSKEYIANATSLSCITVDDQVFVSNPDVITKMVEDTYPYKNTAIGIATTLGSSYGRTYTLSVGASGLPTVGNASLRMPAGSASTDVFYINIRTAMSAIIYGHSATQYEITSFRTLANNALYGTAVTDESVLMWADAPGLLDLRYVNSLSSADTSVVVHKGTCKRTGLLPRLGMHDLCVQISGAGNTEADDYWLRFSRNDESTEVNLGEGVWVEAVAPDIQYRIDSSTMPRRIVKEADGSLTIERVSWKDRRVGDDLTNPIPSFINHGINDISLFQGRLVFLAGPNVILSRSSKYTDFWKNSATTLVDDDVIDISSATTESTPIMRKAVPHARDLVIFSDTAQFILFGRTSALTPKTASLVLTTTYEANLNASPVASGKNIFYAIDYGNNTGIKEFYTESEVDINNSRPITSHCTQYLTGRIKHMATSTNFDMLLVQTNADDHDIYLYESIWINEEKRQSAWSRWRFQHQIKYFYFDNDAIVFVCNDPSHDSILLKMHLDRPDDGVGFQAHLDHKLYVPNVHLVLDIPDFIKDMDGIMFVQGVGCPEPGLLAPVDTNNGSRITLQYSMNGGTVIMGIRYKSMTTFTKPVYRDNDGKAVITGTLSIHHFECVLHNSGYVEAVITSPYFDDTAYDNMMWVMGSAQNTLGSPAVMDMTWVVPYMHDVNNANLTLQTDRHTPLRITQISWKGDLIKKGTHL